MNAIICKLPVIHALNMFSGISAVSITYPLDIIRARIAFQVTGDHLCIGLTETAGCIIKQDGIMGLYRGMTPTLLGMIPYAGL